MSITAGQEPAMARHLAMNCFQSMTDSEFRNISHTAGDITDSDRENLIAKSIETLAKKWKETFPPEITESPTEEKFETFLRNHPEKEKELVDTVSGIFKAIAHKTHNGIQQAGVAEAVFSKSDGPYHTLTTRGLTTCIGVAGYDPINRFGFVVHFSHPAEVKNSADDLIGRISAYKTHNPASPLFIHLRGGYKNASEGLLKQVEELFLSRISPSFVVSRDVLHDHNVDFSNIGQLLQRAIELAPLSDSIKLNLTTGSCEPCGPQTPSREPSLHQIPDLESTIRQECKISVRYDFLEVERAIESSRKTPVQ